MATKHSEKVQADKLIGQVIHRRKCVISDKESIMYALAIGFSQDPLKEQDFKYTSDVADGFGAFPLFGSVSHQTDFITPFIKSPHMPVFDTNVIRHVEQTFRMYKDNFDLSLEYDNETKITDVIDKGKHMLVWFEVRTTANNQLICTNDVCILFQGMGGFGYQSKKKYPPALKLPSRKPDSVLQAKTYPNQAFFFRLTGDRNPLHLDLKEAKKMNLKAPILHGMATFGTIGRVLSQEILGNDPCRMKAFHTRFTGIVCPGDTLALTVWKEGENLYVFEAEVVERKTKAIIGSMELHPVAKL